MTCTKSQLVSAINSYAAARASNDTNLLQFSVNLVTQLIEQLEDPYLEITEEVNRWCNESNTAAKYYKEESHQIAAWNYLQSELSAEQLIRFNVISRLSRRNN